MEKTIVKFKVNSGTYLPQVLMGICLGSGTSFSYDAGDEEDTFTISSPKRELIKLTMEAPNLIDVTQEWIDKLVNIIKES